MSHSCPWLYHPTGGERWDWEAWALPGTGTDAYFSIPTPSPAPFLLSHPHPYPDKHREQTPAARSQADVGIQEILMDMGVGEQGKPGQD